MTYYVYKITNNCNSKVYIGKSVNPHNRYQAHLTVAKLGSNNPSYEGLGKYNYIHKAITKYGKENFSFEIIASFATEEESFQAEKNFISLHKSRDSQFGYNLTNGGEGVSGRKHTENAISKIRNKAIGRLHTPETKRFLSEERSGEKSGGAKLTEEQVKEIRASDETSVILAKKYGVGRHTISDILLHHTWKNVVALESTAKKMRHRLTPNQIFEIRNSDKSVNELVKVYSSNKSTIRMIRNGQSYKHLHANSPDTSNDGHE